LSNGKLTLVLVSDDDHEKSRIGFTRNPSKAGAICCIGTAKQFAA
jgi:hypothetical protein